MGILQDCNLMYSSPRRVLFVHNKSATGRSRGDGGGLASWTGAKVEGHATRGRSNLPEGIRAEGAAHARADSGVLGGHNARGRARFVDFLEAATRPLDGFVGAFWRRVLRSATPVPSAYRRHAPGMQTKGERVVAHESPPVTQ